MYSEIVMLYVRGSVYALIDCFLDSYCIALLWPVPAFLVGTKCNYYLFMYLFMTHSISNGCSTCIMDLLECEMK